MFPKIKTFALVALIGLGMSSSAFAGQATSTVAVSASVSQTCSISPGSVAFGAYNPLATTDLAATGSLSYACVKGATGVTIGLDNGANYASSTRNMKGTTSLNLLGYTLWQDAAHTIAWDNATSKYAAPTSTSRLPVTVSIYGVIPNGQDVAADSYSDTVNSYINF